MEGVIGDPASVRVTIGKYRVGITFNPGQHASVTEIKEKVAALIDLCESLKDDTFPEKNRCFEEAQKQLEGAAMWAVKGATKQK